MCYEVIVVAEKCARDHPVAHSGQMCIRQCKSQSIVAEAEDEWMQSCDTFDHSSIPITMMAKTARDEETCVVCTDMRNDVELHNLLHRLSEVRVRRDNMQSVLARRENAVWTLCAESPLKQDIHVVEAKGKVLDAENNLHLLKNEIGLIKERIIQRQEIHIINNEQLLRTSAHHKASVEHGPSSSLPFFFYPGISVTEDDAEVLYPTRFPNPDILPQEFKDNMYIVPRSWNGGSTD